MKTLRKIRKNAKALSPVVASIILIAVTVAVSIAVAAWMGALTVGFMGSSSLTITDARFTAGDATTGSIAIDVKNTGTNDVLISAIKVNNDPQTSFTAVGSLPSGSDATVTITMAVTLGNPYKIDLYDGTGQVVGSYQATAN
jgi:flagellin-like protein